MERAAKERLIGAIVLVTVAWLLIPVFLDRNEPVSDEPLTRELALPEGSVEAGDSSKSRRETINLAGDSQQSNTGDKPPAGQEPEISLAKTTTAPVEAKVSQTEAKPEAKVVTSPAATLTSPVVTPPVERKDPAQILTQQSTSEAATSASGQLWAVQMGSFSDKANAERLAADLRKKGYPAFLSQVRSDGRVLHRVRVGPQSDRAQSEATASKLEREGHKGRPVRHP